MKSSQATFANALRRTRRARGLPQEVFDDVSSRTYVSALERGLKQPTLPKVDALAKVLEVHPLTLLALSYVSSTAEIEKLLGRVRAEAQIVLKSDGDGS